MRRGNVPTRLRLAWLLLALLLVPSGAALGQAQATAPAASAAQGPPVTHPSHPAMTPLGPVTYPFNDHWTTKYGPAYADIEVANSNMLACKPSAGSGAAYALCYYSGPAAPTGKPGNPALPCTLSADHKSADCVCYKLSEADYPKRKYYVDINAILNLNVYRSTVQSCGHSGSGCSRSSVVAPACTAVNNGTMMPPAKIVSVFSLAFNHRYGDSKIPKPGATQCGTGLYAGCMTAPCVDSGKTDHGRPLVDCKCPVFSGPYEVGEANASCDANQASNPAAATTGGAEYVWSAAHNPIQYPATAKTTKTP